MASEAGTEHEDGRRTRGRRTRASILNTAADLASVDGLEGLTIGRLAAATGMSKSGLFAHFGSKEELQVATYFHARERFLAEVVLPPREYEPGRERVDALVAGWLRYMRTDVFRGGCFFSEVRTEFGSRDDGPVRQVVVKGTRRWLDLLARELSALTGVRDVDQLAFEIDALGTAANYRFQLLGDPAVFDQAAAAISARLDAGR